MRFHTDARWRALAAATVAALVPLAMACTERLDGSAGCPITCVDQTATVRTEELQAAIATDTTVLGGLGLGTEQQMLLASRGDTLDTRVVVRFDTLPSTKPPGAGTGAISAVNAALLRISLDSSAAALTVPASVDVYDVTTPGNDTSVAALAPLFDAAHLIGTVTVDPGKLVDSVRIPISDSVVLARITSGSPLRLGLRLRAATSAQTRIFASDTPLPPTLEITVSSDTTAPRIILAPYSAEPAGNPGEAASLADFSLVVKGVSTPPPALLSVGGLPARRIYLRFALPSRIVDSSVVVRAALLLTQVPGTGPDASDTMTIRPALVVAGPAVTDPAKAAQIISVTVAAFAPLRTRPADGGERIVELAPAFDRWALVGDTLLPRAIILGSGSEDYSPQQALFYSSAAADPSVRPRLRISYTQRSRIGLP